MLSRDLLAGSALSRDDHVTSRTTTMCFIFIFNTNTIIHDLTNGFYQIVVLFCKLGWDHYLVFT